MVDFKLSEEQVALRQLARDFVNNEAKPIVADLDKNPNPEDCVSDVLLRRCSELGFRTLSLPEKYGGGGVEDTVTVGIVCEELGVADLSLASVPVNGRKLLHMLNPDVASGEVREKWMKEYCDDPGFMVSIAMTPVNAPIGWIKDLAEAGGIEDIHTRMTPEALIPEGSTCPIRLKDGTVCDEAWIASEVAKTPAHEVPVVIHGEWEMRSGARYFSAFVSDPSVSSTHVHDRLPRGGAVHVRTQRVLSTTPGQRRRR